MPPNLGNERFGVQNPLVEYAIEVGWKYLLEEEAVTLRKGRGGMLFYQVLRNKLVEFNPGVITPANVDEVVNRIESARTTIEGNAEVLAWIRGERTVFVESEKRQRNIVV